MTKFTINENGELKGTVYSTSQQCVETYAHVALSTNKMKFVYIHNYDINTVVPNPTCEAYNTIANEQSLYKFLYNQHNCSHGKLTSDISIGSVFNQSHTAPYPTISSEKILDGNHRTIKPSSTFTFTHGASNEMYLFKTDTSLTLHNLTVSGFTSDPSLTIIDSTGLYLGLSGCTFSNNKVYQHIFVEASNNVTDICNSVFQDVRSSRSDPSGGGGAITSLGQTLSIYDSSFIRNSSPSDGGAITHKASYGILTLSGHNYFRDNSCGEMGGAISSGSNLQPHAVQLYGTAEFSGNSAQSGGALSARGSGISLSKGPYEFTGNRATDGPGGAIYSKNEITISADIGTFTKNHAHGPGGALFAYTGGIILDGSFSFVDNSAALGGGALYTENSGISLSKGPYEFSGNHADGAGGAIYSKNEITISADIGTSTFTQNYAEGLHPGGALYAATGTIRLDGSFSFVDNSAGAGGALFTETSGISLSKGPYEFSGNRATHGPGGAIYSRKEITISAETGSTFTNNYAKVQIGGALYAQFGAIRLDGSFSFVDNSSAGYGGALYTDTSGISLLTGPYEFSGNQADGSGEHIWAKTDICYNGLVKKQVTFTDPCCQDNGVWVDNSHSTKCLP